MTDVSGLAGSAAFDIESNAEPNAAQALLSMAAPPIVPDDTGFTPLRKPAASTPRTLNPKEDFPRQAGSTPCRRKLLRRRPAIPTIFPRSIPTITAFTACSSAFLPDGRQFVG